MSLSWLYNKSGLKPFKKGGDCHYKVVISVFLGANFLSPFLNGRSSLVFLGSAVFCGYLHFTFSPVVFYFSPFPIGQLFKPRGQTSQIYIFCQRLPHNYFHINIDWLTEFSQWIFFHRHRCFCSFCKKDINWTPDFQ